MKWYNSLIAKISIIFAIALLGVGAIVFAYAKHTQEIEIENTKKYARAIVRSARNHEDRSLDLEIMKNAGFELIKDEGLTQLLITNKKTGQKGSHRKNRFFSGVKVSMHNQELYVIVQNKLVFKTPHEKKIFPKIFFPLISILFIIFLYIATIRSILPLYSLRLKVKEFADGNYDIDCKSDKKDEIGVLSNEFDKSVKKIKKLRDSRQLFLRNIMHELKTPITKGKLSCAMIEDSTYLNTLKNVFKRQEVLLNEFARIEKLSANEIALKKENYSFQDILDYSLDILNHKTDSVTCKISPLSLNVDFELFGTAIKNLLDNGINYSDDSKVKIESNESQIIISNEGKELEFPLERYSEPYFLEGKKQQSSRGLGFGLFITINIIKLHNMKIEYNRQKNRNVFTINVKKS